MIQNRVFKFLVLLIGSIAIPFVVAIMLIIVSGDRISGMKNFAIPSIVLIHLTFSMTQLKAKTTKKLIYGLIAILATTGMVMIPIYHEIDLNIDMYGLSDLIVFFALASVVTWECLYQIDKYINKKMKKYKE